jgi:hypothetical protein
MLVIINCAIISLLIGTFGTKLAWKLFAWWDKRNA